MHGGPSAMMNRLAMAEYSECCIRSASFVTLWRSNYPPEHYRYRKVVNMYDVQFDGETAAKHERQSVLIK